MVAIEFGDVAVRPPAVVDLAPSDLELVVSCDPPGDFTVGEDGPPMAQVVALLEASVDGCVFKSAEAVSEELDVVHSLAEAVGDAGSNEIEAVLSDDTLDPNLFAVDLIISGQVFLELLAVEVDSKTVAVLSDSGSGGVIELQNPVVAEFGIIDVRSSSISLPQVAERDGGAEDNQEHKGQLCFHFKIKICWFDQASTYTTHSTYQPQPKISHLYPNSRPNNPHLPRQQPRQPSYLCLYHNLSFGNFLDGSRIEHPRNMGMIFGIVSLDKLQKRNRGLLVFFCTDIMCFYLLQPVNGGLKYQNR